MRFLISLVAILVLVTGAATEPIDRSNIYVQSGDVVTKGSGTKRPARGQEYRIMGCDAPETTRAKCPNENEKGIRAAARLIEILNSGRIDLTEIRCPCRLGTHGTKWCNLGRRCGRLTVNGEDVCKILIPEGHAVEYRCSETKCVDQKNWCE